MLLLDTQGHLVSDVSLEELHTFASHIGLKRHWFQLGRSRRRPHYDLTTEKKRHRALRAGAQLVSPKELLSKIK